MKQMTIILIIIAAVFAASAYAAMQPTHKEFVAAVLIGEAGGEGTVGMRAVMNVIANRSRLRHKTFYEVCKEPRQFSCVNGGLVARAKRHQKFDEAVCIVAAAEEHQLYDITGGADHYFNPYKCLPNWASSMRKTITIGNHDFYRSK